MFDLKLIRPATFVMLSISVSLIVAATACAQNRVKPQELSQEVPESAFTEEHEDRPFSERNYRTVRTRKVTKAKPNANARTFASTEEK